MSLALNSWCQFETKFSIILGKISCVEITLTFVVVPCNMLEFRGICNVLFCTFGRSVFKNVETAFNSFLKITRKVGNIYSVFPVTFL